MSAGQWFWLVMILANGVSMFIRIMAMRSHGTHWSDWTALFGGLILIGFSAYAMGVS